MHSTCLQLYWQDKDSVMGEHKSNKKGKLKETGVYALTFHDE